MKHSAQFLGGRESIMQWLWTGFDGVYSPSGDVAVNTGPPSVEYPGWVVWPWPDGLLVTMETVVEQYFLCVEERWGDLIWVAERAPAFWPTHGEMVEAGLVIDGVVEAFNQSLNAQWRLQKDGDQP